MAAKPVEILRKGLGALENKIQERKQKIEALLAKKKSISSADEHWLDNEANLIDEEVVVNTLENASDYDRAIGQLDDKGKGIVQRLREFAGDVMKIAGKKRMHKTLPLTYRNAWSDSI